MRDALLKLKSRARELSIPVLYVNDNFGDWRSEKDVLIGRCIEANGGQFVKPLLPDNEDYFVLKCSRPLEMSWFRPLEVSGSKDGLDIDERARSETDRSVE
jgi:hypothetical protein